MSYRHGRRLPGELFLILLLFAASGTFMKLTDGALGAAQVILFVWASRFTVCGIRRRDGTRFAEATGVGTAARVAAHADVRDSTLDTLVIFEVIKKDGNDLFVFQPYYMRQEERDLRAE